MNSNKVIMTTRTKSRYLFAKSRRLTSGMGIHRLALTGTTAEGYLNDVFSLPVDYAINIDEDAFVMDLNELSLLFKYCVANGFINCGMPDGGTLEIRHHNPCVTNPFFNIFNISEIQKVRNEFKPRFDIHSRHEMLKRFPSERLTTPYDLDPFEPYEDLLLNIFSQGNTLWLEARTFEDEVSTVLLSHRGRPFLVHTWYAREFYSNRRQRKRILAALNVASGRRRYLSAGEFLIFTYEYLTAIKNNMFRRFKLALKYLMGAMQSR